jgi:hypothetical protein
MSQRDVRADGESRASGAVVGPNVLASGDGMSPRGARATGAGASRGL